jgi:hypothetical protein
MMPLSVLRLEISPKISKHCLVVMMLICAFAPLSGCDTRFVPVFGAGDDIKSVKDLKPPKSHMEGKTLLEDKKTAAAKKAMEAELMLPEELQKEPVTEIINDQIAVATEAPTIIQPSAMPEIMVPQAQTIPVVPAQMPAKTSTIQPKNILRSTNIPPQIATTPVTQAPVLQAPATIQPQAVQPKDVLLPLPTDYNPKNIFARSLRSDKERLDRLERAMQDLRNEFDSVRPSIRRLMGVEGDIQRLVNELRTLARDPALTQVRRAPKPAPAAVQPQVITRAPTSFVAPTIAPQVIAPKTNFQSKSPPPMTSGKPTVFDVRIGEHPGKTRIVLDTNAKADFNVDIDNNENIMVVDMPSANWTAASARNFAKAPYISSYKAEQSGNGYLLVLQLKRNVSLASKSDIGGTNGGRRIVLDITGQ